MDLDKFSHCYKILKQAPAFTRKACLAQSRPKVEALIPAWVVFKTIPDVSDEVIMLKGINLQKDDQFAYPLSAHYSFKL